MTGDPFGEIPRDGFGRPKIVPPEGGKAVAYTRCTTYVKCLEDTFNLSKWQQRMVAIGLADRPDLLLAASAQREDKRALNGVVEQAIEAAKGSAAASYGTAMHSLSEAVDRGEPLPILPPDVLADVEAYRAATTGLNVLEIERFVVMDELRVGGTFDRLVEHNGQRYIADLKTGDVSYGIGTIAMQLAVYANSRYYDPTTHARRAIEGVSQDKAIVIHLPAGQAVCNLVWVDIAAGLEAVQLATQVRAWRARKNLSWPVEGSVEHAVADQDDARVAQLQERAVDGLLAQIESAPTADALGQLWRNHKTSWTAVHTTAAATRKAQLAELFALPQ